MYTDTDEAAFWDNLFIYILSELADSFLFVCGFSSHSIIFHAYGNVTIADEGLPILTYATYAQHSWPLSSEGS